MARIAILSALAVGLRSAFIGLPNIQPITAMFFVSVLYLGLVDGFLIMALTMSISGFIFGFGPWVFNQILAFGILMALLSLIAPRLSLVWQIALVTIYPFSTEFSWIIVMASYLRAVLPLLFLAFFMILIMQYRRFYSIHLFSLFLGDF